MVSRLAPGLAADHPRPMPRKALPGRLELEAGRVLVSYATSASPRATQGAHLRGSSMRSKIILVNAGIVILVTLLTYVLLLTSLKGIVSDPNERKHEVERSLRAANAQLAIDGLRFERWLDKAVTADSTRAALGMATPESRQQAALNEANRLRDAAQGDEQF